MQKKTLLIGLGVGCAALILIVAGLMAAAGYFLKQAVSSQGADREVPVAILRVERGSATITTSGASQQVSGEAETEVLTGDEITVSDDGRAAIYWHGYGRTLIDAGTKLRVTEASRPAGEKSIKANILIDIGRAWTRLEQVLELGSEVTVGTSDVVATVRGTSFGVERQGAASSIKVKESKVAASRIGSDAAQDVDAGSKLDVPTGSTGALRTPAKLSDAELNDPFLLAGDTKIPAEDYTLTGWSSAADRWIQGGIEYLAWRPWLFLQIDFGGGGSFREWYGRLPSSIRTDVEAKLGAPNLAEISRLLNW